MKRREFIQQGVKLSLGAGVLLQAGTKAAAADKPITKFPEALSKLLTDLEATQQRYYNVPRADAEFLNLLTKSVRAKNALEIGTANGYSAIWLALALEETDGKLVTVEIVQELVRSASENLRNAGLAQRVEVVQGDGHEVLPKLKGPFDLCFIDAEKGGEVDYFKKLFPDKLAPGGVLIVHNVIRYKNLLQDYLDLIEKHPSFDTVILTLTMEDGFALSYRHLK